MADLTPQQLQIIGLVAKGWKDDRIARELGISASTVQRRLRAAGEALGTHSRVGIAVRAVAEGFVHVEPAEKADSE